VRTGAQPLDQPLGRVVLFGWGGGGRGRMGRKRGVGECIVGGTLTAWGSETLLVAVLISLGALAECTNLDACEGAEARNHQVRHGPPFCLSLSPTWT
jgi:hypothetical protein